MCDAHFARGGAHRVIFGVDVASMLLGGLAAGMVLFIVSVGLSVTMGLMGFVNLAHGGFAMIGGYVIVLAMNRARRAVRAGARARVHRHRARSASCSSACSIRRLYRAPELDQVLFTIGLVFVMIAVGDARGRPGDPAADAAAVAAGADRPRLHDLPHLQHLADRGRRRHRCSGCGSASSAPAWARRSAPRSTTGAWRNRSASISTRLFTITFAFGSGMAALGGGLGAEFLGLDPQYPLKYLVYLPDRRGGRRARPHHRRVLRGADHRRARLRAEEISAAGRHGVHLRADHPAAAVAAAGPVRAAAA